MAPPPVRTTRASLVLRHIGFHSAADDDDPIVRLVSSFLTRVPTWLSALHRDVPEATALWAVQWLVAHDVPEEDSYWMVGHCGFDYTPMDRAAKRGYLSVVQFLHEHSAHGCTKYAVERAAQNGHMEVVRFLYENRWELAWAVSVHASHVVSGRPTAEPPRSLMKQWAHAAKRGHLNELERLHSQIPTSAFGTGDTLLIDVMSTVVYAGYIDVASWLHEHVPEARVCSQVAFLDAIAEGTIGTVRFVVEHRYALDYVSALDHAAEHDQLKIVQLFCDVSPDGCTEKAFQHAARHDNVEMMRLLCEHCGQSCTTGAMDAAAAAGSLETVRYLHEHRTEGCSTDAMDEAAANGHLEIIQYLHEHRAEGCTSYAMDEAAANGHLEVVQFLHTHRTEGCSEAALSGALSNGHMEVVRFLCEVCSEHDVLDHSVVTTCFREKRPDILRYLHASGLVELCPDDLVSAIAFQQLEMIEFVYDHCVSLDHEQRIAQERAAMEEAATRGDMSVVVWLDTKRLHRDGFSSRAIENACRKGHLEVAEYLLMHGHEGPIGGMMYLAAYNGRFDLVRYLQEQRPDRCNHDAIGSASRGGNIEIMRYLCDHRTCDHRLYHYDTQALIKERRFDLLAYLHERDLLELKPDDLVLAIKSTNQLEMLELLYNACVVPAPERRLWILQKAIEEAAKLRAKNVLVWIDSKRMSGEVFLPSKAMEYAATRCHLEITEYLVRHGHDGCSGAVMNLAAFRGCLEVVQYLHETRGDGFNEKALQLAVRKGHADVVVYINENRRRLVSPDERWSACRCRFCMEGNVVQNEPMSPWGDGGDY